MLLYLLYNILYPYLLCNRAIYECGNVHVSLNKEALEELIEMHELDPDIAEDSVLEHISFNFLSRFESVD